MPASPSVERVVVVGGCPAERQDAVMAAARLQPHLLHVGFVKDAVLTDHAGCGAGATAQDRAIHVLIPSEASEPRRDDAEHRDDESRRDGAFADEDICRSAPDRWRGPETVLLRQPALRGAPPAPGAAGKRGDWCAIRAKHIHSRERGTASTSRVRIDSMSYLTKCSGPCSRPSVSS